MNTETMIALTHFKILLFHETGQRFSIEQFVSDKTLARQILATAENSDQEKLVFAALKLRELLGLWPDVQAPAEIPASEKNIAETDSNSKYVKSLR